MRLLFSFLLTTAMAYCQVVSSDEIKKYVSKLNDELAGIVFPNNGFKCIGVFSAGRNIVFQYEVPEDTYFFKSAKQDLIKSIIDRGDNIYFNQKIDLTYQYFLNNKIVKTVNVNWEELRGTEFSGGEYIELTNHPKSNGLEFKIRPPFGWKVEEGDRPHIVKKFTKAGSSFVIYINEIGEFRSKKQVEQLLKSSSADPIIDELLSFFLEFKLIDHELVTIDNHPFLFIYGTGMFEKLGYKHNVNVSYWVSYIEDQNVYFMGMSDSNEDLLNDFKSITNSIILLNQY